jgi:ubiquinone/menaquinone biosynthesis C-methylase UbiE
MLTPAERSAQLYDLMVGDWPGEMDFYRELALAAKANGQAILEVACGTGRVALRLAQTGVRVVGLDLSPQMLAVARAKDTAGLDVTWVQGDMRSFALDETFGLIIVPGHSFQHMKTPADQVAALRCMKHHLAPDGLLVVHLDHQDIDWLGDLTRDQGGVFAPEGEVADLATGRLVRWSRAWWYERATQTASTIAKYEEIGANGAVVERWETDLLRVHCVFRFEMEHLLARVGLAVEAVYGGFTREPLSDASSEMVWVAKRLAS